MILREWQEENVSGKDAKDATGYIKVLLLLRLPILREIKKSPDLIQLLLFLIL
jgi:hypothetical protein